MHGYAVAVLRTTSSNLIWYLGGCLSRCRRSKSGRGDDEWALELDKLKSHYRRPVADLACMFLDSCSW